jgi:hypothetical protein
MNETTDDRAPRLEISPREAVRQLDGEIARLREELSGLVAELDRRRHEALDIKLQVKRHWLETAVTASALLTAGAGFVWLAAWRRRRALAKKALSAAASAGIAAAARKLLGRGMEIAWDRTRSHGRFPRPFLGRGNGAAWWTRRSRSRGAQSGPTAG